jgi:hypothetical protein
MNPTTAIPAPAELAHLAAVILKAGGKDPQNPGGDASIAASHAVDRAWQLWEISTERIARHNAEEAERARLEAERLSGLVPFENVPGYKNPGPFELAVRRALTHFNEPVPPVDVRLVVDGFVFKTHLEILQRYNRELDRRRQENRRKKKTSTPAKKPETQEEGKLKNSVRERKSKVKTGLAP